MTLTEQLINDCPARFSDFDYYYVILEKITENEYSNPDIAIESCKSLLEGLAKSILKHTDKSYIEGKSSTADLSPLFKKAINALAERGANIEEQFTKATGNIIHQMGTLRNERGDISHGKSAPKLTSSSPQLAKLIVNTTDGLAAFLLDELFSLDLSDLDPLQYEDNPVFNEYLEELSPLSSEISYSKALFDQDFVSYEEQLEDFKAEQENEILLRRRKK